jgi:molybdopterin molybdotransferase
LERTESIVIVRQLTDSTPVQCKLIISPSPRCTLRTSVWVPAEQFGRTPVPASWRESTVLAVRSEEAQAMSDERPVFDGASDQVAELRCRLFENRGTERVPLDELARRVLAEPIVADRDVPNISQATMDGFAVATDDEPPLDVRDVDAGPGDDPASHEPGTASRVATGGPVPTGADAVIPVEETTVEDGWLLAADANEGQHVLPRGSVVAAAETVLPAGRTLAPRDAVVLRELGRDRVAVARRLSTGILATGTEIHEGREPDRDSEMLASLVESWDADATLAGSVLDDPTRVGERVAGLAHDHDVVVTTGGTSVGRADETAGVLEDRAEVRVESIPVRPGSNATVAWLTDEEAVVASLPGTPGAAFASALVLVRPLLAGETRLPTLDATVAVDLAVPDADVTFAIPVEFEADATVVPLGHPASSVRLYGDRFHPHRVASCVDLSVADGFVLRNDGVAAGESVRVVPYGAVER